MLDCMGNIHTLDCVGFVKVLDCVGNVWNFGLFTYRGRSPCSLGVSKSQPAFRNISAMSTLPE